MKLKKRQRKLVSMNIMLFQKIVNVFYSGSTVVLTHITKEKIICANCGDSRAILITNNNSIIKMSRDHKPNLPDEKKE